MQSTRQPELTDVAIVGAGPTGLVAAVRLAQLGISYILLDARPGPTLTSNAALVHASTIELLAELEVGDRLVDRGQVMRRIVMVDRGRPLISIQLDDLPSSYPFALGVPQSTTEELLARRLDALGGSVRREWCVEALAQSRDEVAVTGFDHSGPEPVPFELRARFVIGADGSHSVVRSAIGLDFPGDTSAATFVLADIALDAPSAADDEATINLSPQGVTVLGRLPGGNQRMVATVEDGDERLVVDSTFVEKMLRERGIKATPLAEPAWSSQFRIHHRVADRFRVDRVLLAGDAAHIHSPAAGQGMNTGIADGFDLATTLAAVLRGESDDAFLDHYAVRRRKAALEVLRFTDRVTRVATLRSPVARRMRRLLARTVGRNARVKRRVAMWVTGLQRSPIRASPRDGSGAAARAESSRRSDHQHQGR
jgi:2-polyprenyl-6-methoxyphenol hydroxylase-like FAD-dependent oxidoreductase